MALKISVIIQKGKNKKCKKLWFALISNYVKKSIFKNLKLYKIISVNNIRLLKDHFVYTYTINTYDIL